MKATTRRTGGKERGKKQETESVGYRECGREWDRGREKERARHKKMRAVDAAWTRRVGKSCR